MLAPAMEHDATTTTATLESLVIGHKAALFDVYADNRIVGAVVMRVEQCERGPEGVIVAAAAKLTGAQLTRDVLPIIERHFIGVHWIRIHTARPGLVRELTKQRHDYEYAETVLRKKVKP